MNAFILILVQTAAPYLRSIYSGAMTIYLKALSVKCVDRNKMEADGEMAFLSVAAFAYPLSGA